MFSRPISRALTRSFMSSSRIMNSTTAVSPPTTEQAPTVEAQVTQTTEQVSLTPLDIAETDLYDRLHSEALRISKSDEKTLDNQLYEIVSGNTTTPLTAKLVQNKELVEELKSFVEEFTLDLQKQKFKKEGQKTFKDGSLGTSKFPRLESSSPGEPYTPQELFLRRSASIKQFQNLGADIKDVYFPHKDIFHPSKASNLTISKLLAAGAHLGHSKSLYRSSNQQFIYGEYKGIHIIDLEKTLSYLKRASKVIEGVAENGGIILFVGTREGQQRSLEVAASRCGGYYVSSKWVPGTLTNSTEISVWQRHEVDLGDQPTGRELLASETRQIVKPDLIVVLNPVENRVLLNEAMQTRVPTIGIIDTDSESSLVTYPIPANDDSIRATNLIAGVLSKGAELGYKTRLSQFSQYKAAQKHQSSAKAIETQAHEQL